MVIPFIVSPKSSNVFPLYWVNVLLLISWLNAIQSSAVIIPGVYSDVFK